MKFSIRFKNAVKEAFGVFLLACLLGFIFNAASDKGVALIAEPRVLNQAPDSLLTESIDSLEIPGEGFEEPRVITLEQAYRLYTSKKVLFIDARKKQLYEDTILYICSMTAGKNGKRVIIHQNKMLLHPKTLSF